MKWSLIILGSGAVLIALIFVTLNSLDKNLMQATSVQELSGTVKNKGYRKFEKDNATRIKDGHYFYVNEEGQEVQKTLGEEEWFITYEVEQFNSANESVSNLLLENERKRTINGKLRICSVNKEIFEQMNIGDTIYAALCLKSVLRRNYETRLSSFETDCNLSKRKA